MFVRHGVISGVGSGYEYLGRHIQALDMFFNCMTMIIMFHVHYVSCGNSIHGYPYFVVD